MDGTPIIIKKKRHAAHAHHGGSWKVAYADFVTAMMAFFMVMWILGLSDESKSQISGYFQDPMGYSRTPPLTRNIVKFPGVAITKGGNIKTQSADIVEKSRRQVITLKDELDKVIGKALMDAKKGSETKAGDLGKDGKSQAAMDLKRMAEHLKITMTPEGLRIEFQEDKGAVFFQSGSAVVRPEARILLKPLAKLLATSGRSMQIEGHTDSVPYGTGGYDNWDLSQDRANSMRRVLMGGGVVSDQLLSVTGYADTRPRDANNPKSPVNRRVSILLPTAQPLPDEGDNEVGKSADGIREQDVQLQPKIDLRRPNPVHDARDKKPKKPFWG